MKIMLHLRAVVIRILSKLLLMALSGKWKSLAWHYVTHPMQLKRLLSEARSYVSKDGLRTACQDFVVLYEYVRDVAMGKYKDYNLTSLVLVVAALVYLVTPADAVPDFLPVGLVDDVAVITWAARQVANEIERYKSVVMPEVAADNDEEGE